MTATPPTGGLVAFMARQKARFKGHLSLGLSSVLIQVASYGLLFSIKIALSDADFVFVIKQISIVSILASIASLRLEIILFQEHRGTFRRTFFVPILVAGTGLSVAYLIVGPVLSQTGWSNPLSLFALPLGFALSLQDMQNFFCVQENRWRQLIIVRAGQAGGLIVIALTAVYISNAAVILSLYGIALLIPSLIWVIIFARTTQSGKPKAAEEHWRRTKRAAALTLTQLASSAYVHIANLLAISMLSTAQSADFTFLSRIATGPITLIRQVFGQIFLTQCLRLEADSCATRQNIVSRMQSVILISAGLYAIFAIVSIPLVYIFQDTFNIEYPNMLYPLLFVGITQLTVSQGSFARFILHEDMLFLFAEIFKLALFLGLLMLLHVLDFTTRFAIASAIAYGSYFALVMHRLFVRLPLQ